MIKKLGAVAAPLLLHMLLSQAVMVWMTVRHGADVDPAFATAVTAVLVIFPAVWMYQNDRRGETGADASDKIAWKQRLLCGLGCFAAGGILNLAWSRVLVWLRIQEHFSNAVQEELLASQVLVQIVGLGFLVPLAEELIFRGLIYNRMKRILSVRQSIFFSALLFAVYHGNVIQMVFAFPLALILAWIYERGRWFGYPVLFHMGANLLAVAVNLF